MTKDYSKEYFVYRRVFSNDMGNNIIIKIYDLKNNIPTQDDIGSLTIKVR